MPYETCNGASLYFEDNGDGTPIVFLPGVMTGVRFFAHQLADLPPDHRIVALDYRGHGRSEKTETGHTVPGYADDLQTFLDRRDLDDIVLVGWSMGALVAWEYVDRFGTDRVQGLVDVDMSASAFAWDDYEHGNNDLARLIGTIELVQTDQAALIEGLVDAAFKELPSPRTRTLVLDELTRTPPPVKSAILFDYTMRDYRDTLPGIELPTLVCAGADEKWRTVAAVRDVADRIPNAEFELFENSGHCITLEEPERFNRILATFVDGL
ncbi:alpha/beta fold hydrolase [Halegenticoccus tardaugens]|uniref:alpha/beta fold hydrolase n=1 Tax=Halegenticoccus tardaugens TaxID=2071624 RepID=UPI00100ADFDF|nr:alpha/beta hydrolase [Halegenticoccus tardaugens]